MNKRAANAPTKTKNSKIKWWILFFIISGVVLFIALWFSGILVVKTQDNSRHNVQNTVNLNNNSKSTNERNKVEKNSSNFKIISWNVLNYGSSKTTVNSNKVQNILATIKESQASLIGLMEVNYNDEQAVQQLADALDYKYTFYNANKNGNDPKITYNPKFANSKESYGIIYDHNLFKPLDPQGFFINPNNLYARPIYYNLFETTYLKKKFNAKEEYQFITAFGHFDAPDVQAKRGEKKDPVFSGQGTQEVQEAKSVNLVFKNLKEKFPNTDIVLGIDSNIKTKNNAVFDQTEYKLAYEDYEHHIQQKTGKYLTSLGRGLHYANAYDKFLFYDGGQNKNNIRFGNDFEYKFDFVNAFKNKLWDWETSYKLYEQYYKQNSRTPNKRAEITDYKVISNVSDHAPIILNIYPQ